MGVAIRTMSVEAFRVAIVISFKRTKVDITRETFLSQSTHFRVHAALI